jgi:hypothetical protein
VRRPPSLLIVAALASACSIKGIADGARPPPPGASNAGTDAGACAATLAPPPRAVETIATAQGAVGAIAANGTFVVWSSGRSIRACPVSGCTTPSRLFDNLDITGHLALDGNAVFYTTGRTSSHGVSRCSIEQCEDDDSSLGFDLGSPAALAVDPGRDDVFALEPEGRRVIRCRFGRCPEVVASNARVSGAIALGLSNVFWSAIEPPGEIYTCPRSGCSSPTLFAPDPSLPRALVLDTKANALRWTSYDAGRVLSCPVDGCSGPPRALARDQDHPLGIASDGGRIYWANEGAGTIVSYDDAPCASGPTVVAEGLDRPQWIALDAGHVYVATALGTIARIPR